MKDSQRSDRKTCSPVCRKALQRFMVRLNKRRQGDEWGTPTWLFQVFDNKLHFTVDVAASRTNHKCKRYYTKDENGLKQNWKGERVWCNPPYSDPEPWVKKVVESGCTAVLLIPAYTSSPWFHDYVFGVADMVLFVRGSDKL
jgi:phage N-6-adenine-methyltransferase